MSCKSEGPNRENRLQIGSFTGTNESLHGSGSGKEGGGGVSELGAGRDRGGHFSRATSGHASKRN